MTKTSSYNFDLPKELIALKPINPPSSAKLLVYNRFNDKITHTTFQNILEYIPKDTAIVFNDTKVIKARIFGKKDTGGKIELLLNKPINNNIYSCYIRGSVHIDSKLYFKDNLIAKVIKLENNGIRLVRFVQNNSEIDFIKLIEILHRVGHVPLPPYINRKDNISDEKDYQTLFARNYGAVAAPTASLHFTKELLREIEDNRIVSYLTLHVGAGTFQPVKCDEILKHEIHSEYFHIPETTQNIISSNQNILAVGTTVTRTIEYYHRNKQNSGEADIFLHPLNKPKRVNSLLTNFHFPKSTLIMLVSSFLGIKKTLELYNEAIKNRYRFYSYGDGMLIV